MLENVGTKDRWVRAAIGSSLVFAGIWRSRRGGLSPALAFGAGAMLLESAVTRVCPVNHWLGIDTRAPREILPASSKAAAATDEANASLVPDPQDG